jgi:hypothetical protein
MKLRQRPEEIVGRLLSPRRDPDDTGYARKLLISDAAMELTEQLLAVLPASWQRDTALRRVYRAVDVAHRGIDRHPEDPSTYTVVEPPEPSAADPVPVQPVPAPVPAAAPGPGVGGVGMRSMWLAGVLSQHSGLQPLARLVACALAAAADDTGTIPDRGQPTLQSLRESTGVPMFHLHLILRDLDRAGWIDRLQPAPDAPVGARTRYWLALPPAVSETET